LHRQGVDMPNVVICGGPGRGVHKIQEFLRLNEADVGKAVTIIQNPNDTELDILYQSCQFSVFPSFVEGWGLPIGESLWCGKPVICANCASMPEAGGQFAVYFDHGRPESLRETLLEMIRHPVKLPPNVREQLTTWEDTAASICDVVNLDRSRAVTSKVERASA
jgi:glycosyltransferase involved in cell wall biosynthesis